MGISSRQTMLEEVLGENSTPELRPIIIDLGFGKLVHDESLVTASGVKGTLFWMAPEMLVIGHPTYSEKSDMYAIGIILWEVLTGKVPYQGLHLDILQFASHVRNGGRPNVSEVNVHRELMEALWHSNPSERPTAEEFLYRLWCMTGGLTTDTSNSSFLENNPVPTRADMAWLW